MNPSVHAGRPRSLVLPSSEDALSLGPEYTPHGLGWIRLLWHALRAEGRSVRTSFFARASRGGAPPLYPAGVSPARRNGSARRGAPPLRTTPGLFGFGERIGSRIGLGAWGRSPRTPLS